MFSIGFQTAGGHVTIALAPGSTTLIAGPNGVGKSALLATLYRSLPQGAGTYLPVTGKSISTMGGKRSVRIPLNF